MINRVQKQLCQLQLVLNADKTKLMFLTKYEISYVESACYRHQWWSTTTTCLLKYIFSTMQTNWISYFYFTTKKSCFSFRLKLKLVESTYIPILDNVDVLYMDTSAHCLYTLDSVHHVYPAKFRFGVFCSFGNIWPFKRGSVRTKIMASVKPLNWLGQIPQLFNH